MPAKPRTIKLLCCSDTHDRLPPARAEAGAAAWLHAGDVYENPVLQGGSGALSCWQGPGHPDVAAWAAARSVPVFAVRGNHDIADPFGFFTARRDLTGSVVRLAEDLLVAGIGWADRGCIAPPLDGELAEVCAKVEGEVERKRRAGDRVVLLSHYPMLSRGLFPDDPFGHLSDFCFRSVTAWVESVRPVLVVQGHIHQWAGLSAVMKLRGRRSVLVASPGPAGMAFSIGTRVRRLR